MKRNTGVVLMAASWCGGQIKVVKSAAAKAGRFRRGDSRTRQVPRGHITPAETMTGDVELSLLLLHAIA